ncbi:Ligand-binding domain of nuclear hormone receptor [Ostertagia ostertagi]
MNSSGLNIEQLLSSFNNLEIYCDAPEASFYESTPSCSVDISLEEALHFPQRISPRIPVSICSIFFSIEEIVVKYEFQNRNNSKRQLTLGNLKAMWCRDVAHYFEWVAGVPELRLMDVHEKVKLVTRQLCKIICLMLSYWTYGQAHDGIIFGSGIYFTPTERQDETLSSFLGSLANVVQNSITSIFRKIAITREEYLLMKLINLFDTPNVHFPPPDRIVVDAALKKYQAALVNHIKLTHPSLDYNAVTERVSALFGVMPYLELAGQIDDIHWSIMTIQNDGNMRGRLTNEIHVQSTRIF